LVSKCLSVGTHFTYFVLLAASAPPANVMIMGNDPAMLTVTYDRVPEQFRNGLETGYRIRYNNSFDSQLMTIRGRRDLTVTTIMGLVAFTNYSVEVAAVSNQGMGPFSVPVFGLSGEDSK